MSFDSPVHDSGVASRGWTLVVASLGLFMAALDTLVVTTTLPVMRLDLRASLTGLEWTVNAYNLSFACFLLTAATLGDRYGRRRLFTIGLVTFAAASAAAALSHSVGMLVAARAVQGAGAAILMPLSLTLISAAFPAEKRGAAIGLWGGIAGLAVATGPVVGGAIANGLDWHWIFWANVPLGIVLAPLAARRLNESLGPRSRPDVAGLLIASAGVFALTWSFIRANAAGWDSMEVIGGVTAGIVLLAVFVGWERQTPQPMLPLLLFRSPGFAAANGVSFFMYAGLFGVLFLMSQLLQTGLGYSPLQAGLRLLPWTLTPMIVAPIAGALADRHGNRPFMLAGLALQAAGYAWVASTASLHADYLRLALAFTVAGVGTSFCFPTVANAVMSSVSLEHAGIASGTNSAFRELGGVLGVAVLASVFARHGAYGSPETFVAGFSPAVWAAVGLSALGAGAALLTGAASLPHARLQATRAGVPAAGAD